jgi:hypothetical protein
MAAMTITVKMLTRAGEKITAEACIVGRKRRKSGCAWAVGGTRKAAVRAALSALTRKV